MAETINIARPMSADDGGAFASNPNMETLVKQNFSNLLTTKIGERVHRRAFGCNLLNMIFLQQTTNLKRSIQEEIIGVASFWLPYIEIGKISVFFHSDKIPSQYNFIQTISAGQISAIIEFSYKINSKTISDILNLKFDNDLTEE